MDRKIATKLLRDQLDELNLSNWKIRLYADLYRPFLGLCDYKTKTITLNAHHVDTHPDVEIKNTINHECAHALVGPLHGHDDIWKEKAKELGCYSVSPCASYKLSASAIDAIRSGASLEVTFTEETEVVRRMHYKTTKFVDKCEVCGKVAKTKSQVEVNTSKGRKLVITLECLHVRIKDADSQSPFESIVFDGLPNCKHQWNKTVCINCGAKKLYPFQIAGARALERANGRLAIFDEMGLGKTIQALAYLKMHPEVRPFLWVTKAGIKFQHGKEILRVLGHKDVPQVLMTGKDTLWKDSNVISSYDIFRRLDRKMFIDQGFKAIILDECQAIKNPDSSRTREIRLIAKEIGGIIPLSGTPWKNRGSEFFVVLNMLDPARFNSFDGFKRQWVSMYWTGSKETEGGIADPVKFKEYTKDILIRRERTEVLPELPLINRTRILCQLDDASLKVYKEEEDKIIKLLNNLDIGGDKATFEEQSQINQSIMVMKQVIGLAKVPTTIDFAQDFLDETDRKLVIFVHHKKCGELISEGLSQYSRENGYPEILRLTADLDAQARF